jgi:ribonuclease HII
VKNVAVCGIDEVGRGSLAGPVVAGAVVLDHDYINSDIKDSKQLTAKKRQELNGIIWQNAVSIGIGVVCNILIDKIGIIKSTKQAMQLALSQIDAKYDLIIVDALHLNNLDIDEIHPFKADEMYTAVSAASIVSKVYRDNLMIKLDYIFPCYCFAGNKGYGTKEHIYALKKSGPSPLHRRTFVRHIC